MHSPAGPCEWCGGPQHWTIIAGEMYVSCDGGCSPIPGLGLDPPPDSPELVDPNEVSLWIGTSEEGGGSKPYEGAGADDLEEDYVLPF